MTEKPTYEELEKKIQKLERVESVRKKAEEALRKSEEKFRMLFDKAGDSIFIHDEQARMLAVNFLACDRLGYSHTELMSMTIGQVDTPEEAQYTRGRIDELMEQGSVIFETYHQCKDGLTIPVEVNARLINWNDQPAMMSICRDITERKQAEEKLKESEERSNLLLQATSEGLCFHEQGFILHANTKFVEIFGYDSLEEILELKIKIIQLAAPERRELVIKNYTSGYLEPYESIGLRKDGSTFPIMLHGRKIPFEGKIVRITSVRDLTEQKQAEANLKASEEGYRVLVEGTENLVTRVDNEGKFIFVNQTSEKIFGLKPEECIGLSAFDFVHSDDREMTKETFDGWLRDKTKSIMLENRQVSKTGEVFDISWTCMLLYDKSSGHVVGINSIARDITERKRAEEALREEKEFTDTALNSQLDTFFLFDPTTGKAIRWNQAFKDITGYTNEEISEMKVPNSYYGPEGLDRIAILNKEVLNTGIGRIELDLICKDGRKIPYEYNVSMIMDDKGEPKHVISIGRDITERKQNEQKLIRLNNTLEQKVNKRTNDLKQLNEHLIFAEENERSRIASDLHDTVVQTLGYSVSKIKTLKEASSTNDSEILSVIQRLIEQSISETRELIYQFSPPILKDFDISIAIGYLIEEHNKKFQSDITYINSIDDPINLSESKKVTLYRAANELISNIFNHSGVKEAKIELLKSKDIVVLKVQDDGIGFDMTVTGKNNFCGFGLYGLSERCKNSGGDFKIESASGKGTKVVLSLPI